MARIRTIKPEFWKHEDLSELPEATHMLAAALLNYADDEGYFNANPMLIKAACLPLREPSVSIQESLTLLSNIGYIRLGVAPDGKRYGHIVAFLAHQRVSRPTPSKIKTLRIVWEEEGSAPQQLTESSGSAHTQLTESSPLEGKGKEGKGKEEGGADAPATDFAFVGHIVRLTWRDFERWKESYHAVPDIIAELRAADAYYAENPPKDGKWFYPVSSWLKRVHDRVMEERRKEQEAEDAIYAGVL